MSQQVGAFCNDCRRLHAADTLDAALELAGKCDHPKTPKVTPQYLVHVVCGTRVRVLGPELKGNKLVHRHECSKCGVTIEGASPDLVWKDEVIQ